MGFAQLLEYDEAFPADGLQRDNLREISLAGRHLMTLVDEVLDLSRIEQGRLEIELESFRLAPLVNECVSLIRAVAAERGIEIGSAVDERTVIRADRTRLKEVLLNFLSNAVKYNRAEGRVQVSTPDSDPGWTRIQVDDTGPGIERSDLDRLFRPFERLEGALEGTEGTGIGLALAKMLAEAMGGRVGVDSEPGVGSAFWIELPAADGDEPHFWSQRLPAAADTRPRRLVYIEDNPANMRLVRKALATRADLELFEAVDAEQGLELIRRCVPDAVLLDLNLPGRSGMAVLDELKRDVTVDQVPVIAVSANAMPEDVRGALGSGLAAYITKPISIPHFLATVDEVLESEAPEAH
jgi:CheY-like chemotaxis protein